MNIQEKNYKIENFVESYWPLPAPAKEFQRTWQKNAHLSRELLDDRLQRQLDNYKVFLKRKYGDDFNKYLKISEQFWDNDDEETYHKLNSFVFKSGISNDSPLDTRFRERDTLKSLLKKLSKEEEKFTILDLGVGNGKTTVGLALYLENLDKIHAVDINPDAIESANRHIDSLEREKQRIVKNKFIFYNSNYATSEFLQALHDRDDVTGNNNVILALYPFYSFDNIALNMVKAMKINERIITYYPYESDVSVDDIALEQLVVGQKGGLKFNMFDILHFWPNEFAVGTLGKKAVTL
jgi:hypothetical protein